MNGPNGDTKDHLDLLTEMAAGKDTIVEFGVRWGYSTKAFLDGKPKRLLSYDIDSVYPANNMTELKRIARENGVDWKFILQSSHEAEIPECDILFIDSEHTYECVKAELVRHKDKAQIIIFHDTVSFPEINKAILEECTEWKILTNRTFCNGLLVMGRNE